MALETLHFEVHKCQIHRELCGPSIKHATKLARTESIWAFALANRCQHVKNSLLVEGHRRDRRRPISVIWRCNAKHAGRCLIPTSMGLRDLVKAVCSKDFGLITWCDESICFDIPDKSVLGVQHYVEVSRDQ